MSGDLGVITRLQQSVRISPLSLVTPSNHASVRQVQLDNLLSGRREEPHFLYNTSHLSDIAARRNQIADDGHYLLDHLVITGKDASIALDEFVKRLIQTRLQSTDDLCCLAQAILRQDDEAAGRSVLRLYGVPDEDSIRTAVLAQEHPPLRQPSTNDPWTYQSHQIAACFNRVIKCYDLPEYDAIVSPNVTAICVQDGHLCVPSNRVLTESELSRLVGHEIESHLRGRANVAALIQRILGPDNPLSALAPWLAKNVSEEIAEGVAKISDVDIVARQTGNGAVQQPHPWFVLGISRALHNKCSFSENFRWFYEVARNAGQDKESAANLAWARNYRLYRGLSGNSSRDYIYTKDMSYFVGYFRLQRLQVEDPELYQLALDFSSLSEDELASLLQIYQQLLGAKPCDCMSGNATPALTTLLHPRYPHLDLAMSEASLP